ncbi:Detected protein of unknown function [Hibiscus syriacus]|uniref:Uncharacterized protein n=1 Tax=Hibiscus syriacus TaxID=106335 RepID=A0A6A2XKF7_HIBSY|nr:Detected protein of unknown function [Hibiscus syriacus]
MKTSLKGRYTNDESTAFVTVAVNAGDVKGTYQLWSRDFALEWSRNSKFHGKFKISATVNLAGESKVPKIFAESTWDLNM